MSGGLGVQCRQIYGGESTNVPSATIDLHK